MALEGKEVAGTFAEGKGQYGIDIAESGDVEFFVGYKVNIGDGARKLADSSSNSVVKKIAGMIAGAFGK